MFKFFCFLLLFVMVLFSVRAVSGDIGNEIISDELPAERSAVQLSVPLAPLDFMIGCFSTEVRTKDNPRQEGWHLADGELTSEIILTGKAIRLHYRGQIVELPFEGIGIISYSSETGQYQSYWIDDFSGQASFYGGIANSDSSAVFEGKESEFGREVWFKVTYQPVDSRRWISKYDRSEDGRYFWRWMEIDHTRK